ncbi:MAG TPA: hypothetical protein VEQ34_10415 [Pyrinomonadaceae bacterium]|nr:hypothetical protein [Pyrinomonadaceae bacterium]
MNKFKSLLGIFAFSLLLLGVMPTTALAQYGDILGEIFGNGRNNRRNDRNDTYNRRNVEAAIDRVKSRADDFRNALDDALDNSRMNDRNREDRIISVARDFERAANRLEDRYDDGRNSRRNRNNSDVQSLLQIGSQLDSFVYNQGRRLDRRVQNEWSTIRRDLQTIAYAYGYNFGNNDDYYRNDRRNRRNDDNRRNRDNYPY